MTSFRTLHSFLIVLLLGVISCAYSQANGSFFTLQLGKKTCLFKYEEKPDTTMIGVDSTHRMDNGIIEVTQLNPVTLEEKILLMKKSKIIMSQSLTLLEKTIRTKPIRVGEIIDSFSEENLQPQDKYSYIEHNKPDYCVETEMTLLDFLDILKSRFEFKNPERNFCASSYLLYYETPTSDGHISVKYPDTGDKFTSRLYCLSKGGFILLSIREADNNNIHINTDGNFLALIHIKN